MGGYILRHQVFPTGELKIVDHSARLWEMDMKWTALAMRMRHCWQPLVIFCVVWLCQRFSFILPHFNLFLLSISLLLTSSPSIPWDKSWFKTFATYFFRTEIVILVVTENSGTVKGGPKTRFTVDPISYALTKFSLSVIRKKMATTHGLGPPSPGSSTEYSLWTHSTICFQNK